MAYWVVKSRPDDGGIDFLRAGKPGRWRTTKPPKDWSAGDRLFFWIASPHRKLVGLGQIDGHPDQLPYGEVSWFPVRYHTGMLAQPLSISQLRQYRVLANATFLKSGPSGTIYRLTDSQGELLHRLVVEANPEVTGVWSDILPGGGGNPLPDVDLSGMEGTEGRKRLVAHLRRERDPRLVERKKAEVRARSGELRCEICALPFVQLDQQLGEACCEVHHGRPLAAVDRETNTTMADLHILCSNCHRMIHRTKPLMTVAEFREYLGRRA